MIEMVVPEPKTVKDWRDFNGGQTDKHYLQNAGSFIDIRLQDDSESKFDWVITIQKSDCTIPEAIAILNALGFNFKEATQ